TDSNTDSHSNCHADSDTYTDADTDANGSRNSDTYPDLRAGSIPGAHSVFRYRWTADHAAKPDTCRTRCDCGGPLRRLLRHAHAGAVSTVQHRSGLLQQRV